MVFHWSLSDRKSPQVSRILLSIQADLNKAIVWMISTRPLISLSFSLCTNLLVTVPSAPITIGISVTFMFHSFFNSLKRSRNSSLFSASFSFALWSAGTVDCLTGSIFLLTMIRSGHLAEIRWSKCTSKSHRIFCISFSRMGFGLSVYHLFVWSNLNFLHNSQWSTLPTQLCLVLYSFCVNLLHLITMIISSLSLYRLNLLFCCLLSILALKHSLWRCFVLLLEEIQFFS